MYRKEDVILVTSPIQYLHYIITSDNVKVWEYDTTQNQELYELERVYTLSTSLFSNQFAIDVDRNGVYLSPTMNGKYIKVVYYSDGQINPFYASSNLHKFITNVLKWTGHRIVDGCFLHWTDGGCVTSHRIKEGSFVYSNQYYIYAGEDLDIRNLAPPTIVGRFRGYYFFINDEIISNNLNHQTRTLTKMGYLHSSAMHDETGRAKLDVLALYDNLYSSEPLNVAFMYVYLTQSLDYEIWIEYPTEHRTL